MSNIYVENKCVTLLYNDELQLGTAIWEGFLSSQDFRECVEECLRMIEEHKPLRWLGDNRKLRVIRQADQDWFVERVFPRLAASSIRRNASIVSEDIFNKMAVEQIVKRAQGLSDMLLKDFDSEDAALQWLNEPIE